MDLFDGSRPTITFLNGGGIRDRVEQVLKESISRFAGLPITVLIHDPRESFSELVEKKCEENGIQTFFPAHTILDEIERSKSLTRCRFEDPRISHLAKFAMLPWGAEIIAGNDAKTQALFSMMVYENELRLAAGCGPRYIAPVCGIGGEMATFADTIYTMPMSEELKKYLPDQRIYDGRTAAEFLIKKLDLK